MVPDITVHFWLSSGFLFWATISEVMLHVYTFLWHGLTWYIFNLLILLFDCVVAEGTVNIG